MPPLVLPARPRAAIRRSLRRYHADAFMITSQLMCVQEEEPDTPPAPSTMMLLSDHSGQPTKSRNLAEKMEATRMQLKTLVYEALANHAYLTLIAMHNAHSPRPCR